MNVSLRRQLGPGGFRFGMRKNQCVCVYQLWPWALSAYPSENGWQPLKVPGDCTYGLKPLPTQASDRGRETSLRWVALGSLFYKHLLERKEKGVSGKNSLYTPKRENMGVTKITLTWQYCVFHHLAEWKIKRKEKKSINLHFSPSGFMVRKFVPALFVTCSSATSFFLSISSVPGLCSLHCKVYCVRLLS